MIDRLTSGGLLAEGEENTSGQKEPAEERGPPPPLPHLLCPPFLGKEVLTEIWGTSSFNPAGGLSGRMRVEEDGQLWSPP